MIKNIHIQNFKSLKDTGKLEIKPLTILVGANNSGKTSILQALMLIKQSLESQSYYDPIILHGKYLNLGSFEEMIFNQEFQENKLKIAIEFRGGASRINQKRRIYDRRLYFSPPISIDFSVGFDEKRNQIILEKSDILLKGRREIKYSIRRKKDNSYELYARTKNGKKSIKFRKKGLPIKFFDFSIFSSRRMGVEKFELIEYLKRVSSLFENEFKKIKYIGPLRVYPERIYQQSEEEPIDVGLRGEKTIDVLWNQFFKKRGQDIIGKINNWFESINMNIKIDIRSIEKRGGYLIIDVINTETNLSVNLSDVGFGISQILPVLVLAIYSPYESIVLMEQPEIHLHPKLQSDLGDFLSEVATMQGKTVIVETHSEHLINRIKRNIADPNNDISEKDVIIYYLTLEKGVTQIQKLELNEFGQAKEWPSGFFEERIEETIAHMNAISEKRKMKNATK